MVPVIAIPAAMVIPIMAIGVMFVVVATHNSEHRKNQAGDKNQWCTHLCPPSFQRIVPRITSFHKNWMSHPFD